MTNETYNRLVSIIREHHTWICLLDSDTEKDIMVHDGEYVRLYRNKVLRLRSVCRMPNYPTGRTWEVPMFEINRAVQKLSENDLQFMQRMKRLTFDYCDVNNIILQASYGIINLTRWLN